MTNLYGTTQVDYVELILHDSVIENTVGVPNNNQGSSFYILAPKSEWQPTFDKISTVALLENTNI